MNKSNKNELNKLERGKIYNFKNDGEVIEVVIERVIDFSNSLGYAFVYFHEFGTPKNGYLQTKGNFLKQILL